MTYQSKPPKSRAKWLILLLVSAALLAFIGYKILGSNVRKSDNDTFLYIKTGATYDQVLQSLKDQDLLKDYWSFNILAKQMQLHNKIKAGKYKLTKGMSNLAIIRKLRNGQQDPVKLVINKIRTQDEWITFISSKIEADTTALRSYINNDTFLSNYGLNTAMALGGIIPDTYELWWNTSAKSLYEKLFGYYTKFWNSDRISKAKAKGLTPNQVMIIASIVEEETNKTDEKQDVASVYINRIRKGMKLQADPTVKFAANDFTIRRITGTHLQIISPYNTYQVVGLPPGPICTPSKNSVEAVLNANETNFIFFCIGCKTNKIIRNNNLNKLLV